MPSAKVSASVAPGGICRRYPASRFMPRRSCRPKAGRGHVRPFLAGTAREAGKDPSSRPARSRPCLAGSFAASAHPGRSSARVPVHMEGTGINASCHQAQALERGGEPAGHASLHARSRPAFSRSRARRRSLGLCRQEEAGKKGGRCAKERLVLVEPEGTPRSRLDSLQEQPRNMGLKSAGLRPRRRDSFRTLMISSPAGGRRAAAGGSVSSSSPSGRRCFGMFRRHARMQARSQNELIRRLDFPAPPCHGKAHERPRHAFDFRHHHRP